jgi:hypothetical protein
MTRLGRSSGLTFYAEAQGCKENLVHSGLPLREFHTQKLRETSVLTQYIPTSTDHNAQHPVSTRWTKSVL